MRSHHRTLLDDAVRHFTGHTGLRGRAVYVTGASGFLAASLIAFLSEVDRTHGLGLRLYASARRPLRQVRLFDFLGLQPSVEWTVAAVEDTHVPDIEGLILVHAASYGSPRDYLREPLATFSANTQGLITLLQGAPRLRQFVYFSSAEIYGQPPDEAIPTPEGYVGAVPTLHPRSIYAESKRMGEVLATSLAQTKGVPLTVLRPWNLYGPGQRLDDGRVPVEFIRQARESGRVVLASNGQPSRAFCHAWDGISQIAATLGHPAPLAAFNIGNPTEEIRMLELARLCATTCGLSAQAVQFDPNAVTPGMTRCAPEVTAVSRLAGAPAGFTPLATGLRTLVEWHDFLRSA